MSSAQDCQNFEYLSQSMTEEEEGKAGMQESSEEEERELNKEKQEPVSDTTPSLPEAAEKHLETVQFLCLNAIRGIRQSLLDYYAHNKF